MTTFNRKTIGPAIHEVKQRLKDGALWAKLQWHPESGETFVSSGTKPTMGLPSQMPIRIELTQRDLHRPEASIYWQMVTAAERHAAMNAHCFRHPRRDFHNHA